MQELGIEWKVTNSDGTSALECMTGGELEGHEVKLKTTTGEGKVVEFEQKKELRTL